MTDHIAESRLNDFVDGLLPAGEEAAVTAHLAACRSCREEERRLRALISDLAALPRAIQPPRDLGPSVRARIAASHPARAAGRLGDRTLRSVRWPLAAVAAALVATTVAVTTLAVRDRVPSPMATSPAPAADATTRRIHAELRVVEAEYARATGELLALIEAQRAALGPEAVRLLSDNLAVIDQALRESRAAIAADPNNPELRRWIVVAYERKLDLLRGVAQLTTES